MDEVELAQELMKFNTVSPVTDPDVMEFLERFLQVEGVDPEIKDIGGVKNLVVTTGEGETSVCLNGHLDVVPPGKGWSVAEPFDPVVKNGRLYGRGAADMKAAVAAEVMAFVDLHNDPEFEGKATLMVVGDEEKGGFNGTKALLQEMEGFDYAVIGEPTDFNVQIGTRGVLWITVFVEGETGHASRPEEAENVIDYLPLVVRKLQGLELEYEPDGIMPSPTFTVTGVETDMTQNSVPAEAIIQADVRYVPGQDPQAIVKAVEDALKQEDVSVRVESVDHGGAFILEDEQFKKIATDVVADIRGEQPDHITEGGSSDGRFFAQNGTPFIELGMNQEPVHKVDESCSVERIRQLRIAYRDVVKQLVQ